MESKGMDEWNGNGPTEMAGRNGTRLLFICSTMT